MIGCDAGPERLTMRANTWPVTVAPPGPLTTGSCSQWRPATDIEARTAVPLFASMAALSPCQALARPISPNVRSAATMVVTLPRLGTSCHIMPLAFARSTGLVMTKLAV